MTSSAPRHFAASHDTRMRPVGESFELNCPPDVSFNTRILAVCGTHDAIHPRTQQSIYDPNEDSWFLSDFYLFYHLFKHATPHQKWLTAIDPAKAVARYGEYAHGNSDGDKVVVLDQHLVTETQHVIVVGSEHLLEQVQDAIAAEGRAAAANNQPLMIMLFGHSDGETNAVYCGGNSEEWLPNANYMLSMTGIARRLGPDVQATIFLSSCYSGQWVVYPSFNNAVSAAAHPEERSLAWPMDASFQRTTGERMASAIANALIEANIPDLVVRRKLTPQREIIGVVDDPFYQAKAESKTLTGFLSVLHGILKKQDQKEPMEAGNVMHFSAQDDLWDQSYAKRTGVPLAQFQERYNELRRLPQGAHYSEPLEATRSACISVGRFTFQRSQYWNAVALRAQEYLLSFPGDACYAHNRGVYRMCQHLLTQHWATSDLNLLYAKRILHYRLHKIMRRATAYKNTAGLDYLDCNQVDAYKEVADSPGPERATLGGIKRMVTLMRLFPAPDDDEEMAYDKGSAYLALAFFRNGYTEDTVAEKLNVLQDTAFHFDEPYRTIKTYMIDKLPEVRDSLGSLSKSTRKRLRSMSPRKHPRRSIKGLLELGDSPSVHEHHQSVLETRSG
jgi:hypothetical protein